MSARPPARPGLRRGELARAGAAASAAPVAVAGGCGGGLSRGGSGLLAVRGRLGRRRPWLPRPLLVEVDAPLALLVLLELELGAERASRAPPEAGDLLGRAPDRRLVAALLGFAQRLDQLLGRLDR